MLHRAGASEPLPDGICVGSQARVCAFGRITGDLVHEGTSADYARAKTLLQELDEQYHTKTYPALGNHDIRKDFNSAFRGLASDQPLDYCVQTEWLRWIVLDSSCGQVIGQLSGSQLAWLEQELCKPTDCPTILALHHPVYGTTTAETDANNLATPDRLIRLLQDHPVDGIPNLLEPARPLRLYH